jgi:predicted PurR-regulated permease PerM
MALKNKQIIDLSILSIVKFFLVVLFLVFLFLIKEVLAIVFVALILASSIDPWVDKLEKIKVPRWLSILFFYVLGLSVIVGVVFLLVPPITAQVSSLAENFPKYAEKIGQLFTLVQDYSEKHGFVEDLNAGINSLKDGLTSAAGSAFAKIFEIFGGLLSFLVVLVIAFYMANEESALKKTLTFFVPDNYREFVIQLINKMQAKIGSWLVGQLVLCLIIGIMSYVGLLILGVEYALLLAVVAALGEFVPMVGPVLTTIPAVLLASTQSPTKGLFVLILFVVIQQIESNILAPKIMQKAVGLNPIVTIVALLIGAKIGGVVGVMLSIPVATAVSVMINEIWGAKDTIEEIAEDVAVK